MSGDALRVEQLRGARVESAHAISAAVVDPSGALVAHAGDAERVTFWRSAGKPFQAMPLLEDGAADRWGFSDEALALACASHSSEPRHLAICSAMLAASGGREDELACGPHPPLSAAVATDVVRHGVALTPRWSNCSGKHAGMLALARHHRWPVVGYERAEHPVQRRIGGAIARWTGVPERDLVIAVDGCTAVSHALPLRAMALGYARLGATDDAAARRIRSAMAAEPWLVAGTGRPCTDLMIAARGEIIAKVGAAGVYGAAVPSLGIGIALKVEDGDGGAAPVALLAILAQLLATRAPSLRPVLDAPDVARHATIAIRNTRGEPTGVVRAAGAVRGLAPARDESVRPLHSSEVS
jgi:L-asparaginase II